MGRGARRRPGGGSLTPAGNRRDKSIAAGGFVLLLIVRRLLSGRHAGPFITDEAGYLGNARWLADTGSWLMDTSPYYRWGYSLLLVPFEWLSNDPGTRFQMVHWLNLALVASVFPLLYALLRLTRGTRPVVAALAAAVAALLPGLGSSDGMAMAENLLIPLYLLSLLALWGLIVSRGAGQWWFGLTVLALWATHRRMVVVVVLAVVVIVAAGASDRRRLKPAAVNLAVLLLGLVPVQILDGMLLDDRWLRVGEPESLGGGPLGLLGDPGRWDTWVSRMVGQAWYLLAGSYGLVLFGVVALIAARSRDWDPGGAGPGLRERIVRADPARLLAAFQVAVLAGTLVLAAMFFTLITERPDHRVYGRYVEVVLAPVVATGAVWLMERRWVAIRPAVLSAGAGVVAGLAVLVLPDGFAPFRSANYSINQVAAVSWLGSASEVPLVAATLAAVGALVALWALSRSRAVAVWLIVVAVAFGAAVVPVEGKISRGQTFLNGRRAFPTAVSRLGPLGTVAFDIASASRSDAAVIQFWLDDTRIVPWPEGSRPPAHWVVAAPDATRVLEAGGRMVFVDTRLRHALWVLPGAEQRRLLAAGRLLPSDLTDRLPAPAQAGSVTLAFGADRNTISLDRDGSADVSLNVRHGGAGVSWVDGSSYVGRGSVRLGVRWYDAAGKQVSFPFERADLPRTLWPGQSANVTFHLRALAGGGQRLPTGTYTAAIVMLQEGVGELTDVDALRLRVAVT